jgi:hypothetical protein
MTDTKDTTACLPGRHSPSKQAVVSFVSVVVQYLGTMQIFLNWHG